MAGYLTLNIAFLAVVFLLVFALSRRQVFTKATLISLAALLLLTAVFDNLIIMSGIVGYDPTKLSGLFIGAAPIEDFAYTVAAVLFVPFVFNKARKH